MVQKLPTHTDKLNAYAAGIEAEITTPAVASAWGAGEQGAGGAGGCGVGVGAAELVNVAHILCVINFFFFLLFCFALFLGSVPYLSPMAGAFCSIYANDFMRQH